MGSNLLCLSCHLYFARPQAGEATHGYMHGGVMLDFVGQLGPTSKLRLFLLDAVILLLQLVALSATLKRRELAKASKNVHSNPSSAPVPSQTEEVEPTAQDHDAEERGVLRRASSSSTTAEASEPRSLPPEQSVGTPRQSSRAIKKADLFWSGQSTIVELHLWDTIKEAPTVTTSTGPELQAQFQRNGWQFNLPFRS